MRRSREQIKEIFERDTKNHTMEVLMDNGVYRHLSFTNNGSQCYRFDLVTWPGHLAVSGDMGDYMFARTHDMFNFFEMDKHDFNYKHIVNPHYWAEKCVAAGWRNDSIEEFSMDTFKENVLQEYENFKDQFSEELYNETEGAKEEALEDSLRDEVVDIEDTIAAHENNIHKDDDTQSVQEMLDELLDELTSNVLQCDENEVRAYDAAMDFSWKSEDGEFEFDMTDFWDHDNKEYTYHYIWILYAIVWGIKEYNESKLKVPVPPPGRDIKEGVQPA